MKFVPLHIVTGYSFLQSGLTIEKIAKAVKANNYFGVGVTDNEVMYGIPHIAKMAQELNKPFIAGEEFLVEGDHLSLYVISEEGYRNLMSINNSMQKEELTLDLIKKHSSGLVAILETIRGTFKEKFVEDYDSSFNKYLLRYSSIFSDNFYLGIEVTSKEDVKYANRVRKFANEFTYKCIAFPRIRYEKKDDAIVINMVDAISNDQKLDIKKASGQDYFMKEEDYAKIYSKNEIENTVKLVQSSTFDLHQKRGELLHYQVNDSKEELSRLCHENLKKLGIDDEKHIQRLEHELDVIFSMGYADYFLIVQDYVNYAKTHDILVGPGRGSAAGSLVSYVLNISEVDPLDYDLQFERFLNPHRKTMPDIDVDFMDTKRDAMVQYMKDKYGANRVANIVTFQTIGAKQSLRDIGRIYDLPTHHIDLLSKRLTNKDFDLRDSYRHLPEFRSLVDSDPYFLEIVSLASKIEGLPRQSGLHAAGIVLDEKPLEESIPVTILMNDNYVSQYEMEFLEAQGLLKMDFLSLSNLTIIYNCVALINQNHKDVNVDPDKIPYDAPEIFDLISKNKTMGLFQIETNAMKKAIRILKPSNFDDVVALLALNRPGPMEYIPNYARRKEGKEKINYVSEDLKEILAPTYGIIVYQEQINSIATKMAGFSLGEADVFRRAISKKEKEQILSSQKQFIEGAIKNGYSEDVAKKVFNNILRFAEYGFNKSHSVVYSIIACRMAWLKVHYPLEFYSALLGSSAATSDSKFNEYVAEMNSLGIKMLPPSINYSSDTFIIKDNALLFPLTSIKDINISLMSKIAAEREENGLFKDFFNFVLRMFNHKISENQMQSLISSGALDEFYPSRESMRLTVKSALQYAELNHSDDGQLSIGIDLIAPPRMNKGVDDPLENLDKEYEAIGIMLSDNPLRYKRELLEKNNVSSIIDAKEMDKATVAGIIKSKKVINTKKGTPMAFVKIFDETGDMELTIFPTQYGPAISLIEKNNIIVAQITHQISKGEESYIVDEIKRLEEE